MAFFSIYSLKYFDQINDEQLEKFNVAILLTDILIAPEDIKATYTIYDTDMSLEILKHPETALATIPKDPYFESSTIINLIKSHHEKPDGSGYPHRLSCTRFDIFLCTHFIAEQLVFKLMEKKINLNELPSIYKQIYDENRKFSTPNFNRVFDNFDKFFKGEKK